MRPNLILSGLLSAMLLGSTACQAQAPDGLPKVASGQILRWADMPSQHVPPRHVDIWLPASYDGQTPHAVLYMHDGQMLYDSTSTWNRQEWMVDETAGRLIAEGRCQPFIIVGVWNNTPRRWNEYMPQKPFQSCSPEQQAHVFEQAKNWGRDMESREVYSDRYLRFLVEELKPAIDSAFKTLPDAAHTAVAGSSMGGLISMYALSEYPEVFGGAACLSTHWVGLSPCEANPLPAALLAYLSENVPPPATHRLYFDHGTETLDAYYPVHQQQADALLRARGYSDGPLWRSLVFPGTDHSERAWQQRMHVPFEFLFGR